MKVIPFIAGCMLSLTASVLLSAQQKPYLDHLSDYIENLAVFEENQEPGRAFHIPERHLSLNGTWKFAYYESPRDVPEYFFAPSFNDRKWGSIEVPSNWEMQGYGQAVFRNVSAPFQVLPPKETLDSYRRRYEDPSTPESFKGFLLSRMGGSLTPPPLAVSVPQVPAFNPTGAYRTSFTLPKDWKETRSSSVSRRWRRPPSSG